VLGLCSLGDHPELTEGEFVTLARTYPHGLSLEATTTITSRSRSTSPARRRPPRLLDALYLGSAIPGPGPAF